MPPRRESFPPRAATTGVVQPASSLAACTKTSRIFCQEKRGTCPVSHAIFAGIEGVFQSVSLLLFFVEVFWGGGRSGRLETKYLKKNPLALFVWCVCVCMCVCVSVCVCACVCVCVRVFIKLHVTAQSGPVILVILCHSH